MTDSTESTDSTERTWPRALRDANGPMRADKVAGAALGMGDYGPATRALHDAGYLAPDLMTGLSLFLLGNQPRKPKKDAMPGAGGGVAGGVWVRERFTIYRPLRNDEPFTVSGESVGRYVHKGRRYSTTQCETCDGEGRLVARNLSTGLLAYKVDATLGETQEGVHPDALDAPAPDRRAARDNPCLDSIRACRAGERLNARQVLVGLDLMQARDTATPDNPIHSDPALAKKAGLERPIAGGSHVLAFALEPIIARLGTASLLHGASFDVRWKAPVFADVSLMPEALVTDANDAGVRFELTARLDGDAVAMTAAVEVPLP
ncbi:MAG: MaoC family dehydratase [Pseudomonadota bacterium]